MWRACSKAENVRQKYTSYGKTLQIQAEILSHTARQNIQRNIHLYVCDRDIVLVLTPCGENDGATSVSDVCFSCGVCMYTWESTVCVCVCVSRGDRYGRHNEMGG